MRASFDDGVHVGFRGQITASLLLLQLFVPIDFYPLTKEPWRVAFVGQLSF